MNYVIEDDEQYSVARIATLVTKSRHVAVGDEHIALKVRHLQRRNVCFIKFVVILTTLYCWSPLETKNNLPCNCYNLFFARSLVNLQLQLSFSNLRCFTLKNIRQRFINQFGTEKSRCIGVFSL